MMVENPPVSTAKRQGDLFDAAPDLPEGLRYASDALTRAQEAALLAELPRLPFREFEFHGFTGKRRVVSFGYRYDFNGGGLSEAAPIPDFLHPAREAAARFAGLAAEALRHAHLIEYRPGASIGWHKDRPEFEDVIGLSLLSPCTFRLRRKVAGKWERHAFMAEPRSAYLLRGHARHGWEHSIPALPALRYSITFRSLAERTRAELRGN
jgi:alkylated DNA repair dioxygenase AlkB